MKFNVSQKGSAYLSVLLVILITSILGVTLLTFSLANFKTTTGFFATNAGFYQTDSIISEAQIKIENQVRIGQDLAKEYVTANRDAIIKLSTDLDEKTGIITFNEDTFNRIYKEYFCDSFNKYMCEDNKENGKKVILALKDSIPGITNIIMPEYGAIMQGYEYSLQDKPLQDLFITIEATKNANTVNAKSITAKFKLLREPAVSIKKVISRLRNPIWMRAVTAEGDLIAVGGTVNIKSSENDDKKYRKAPAVYAWGTNKYRTNGSNALGYEYGGIIAGVNQNVTDGLGLSKFALGSQSGNINITGETFTDSYIHTFGNNSSISIDVDTGETEAKETLGTDTKYPKVFAESIQTEEFSNNNIINIIGDAMVKDDLELNSSGNSKIDIKGSFLGISSGPSTDYGTDKYSNRSSSIAYNDTMETSKINIGKYIVVSGVAYNSNIIYDVAPYENTPYKTGESLGIGENHKIYRYYFDGEDPAVIFDTGYKLDLSRGTGGKKYDYPIYSGKTGAPPNGVGNNRVERFKQYLIKSYKGDGYLDYETNLGGNDVIQIGGNNAEKIEGYSLGVIPANGRLYMPTNNLSTADKSSMAFIEGMLKSFDYIFAGEIASLKDIWSKIYDSATWITNKGATRKSASEFATLVDYNINFETNYTSPDNSIILKATSGNIEYDISDLNNKGGLIYSDGDVVISGNSDGIFRGSIVAKGCVVFKGSGEKTIIYDEKNVLKAIKENSNVKAFFSKGGLSEIDPDEFEIELKSQKNVKIDDYREVK